MNVALKVKVSPTQVILQVSVVFVPSIVQLISEISARN